MAKRPKVKVVKKTVQPQKAKTGYSAKIEFNNPAASKDTEDFKKQASELQRRYDILEMYTKKVESKIKELEEQKKKYIQEQSKKNEDTRKEILKEKEIRVRDVLIKQMQIELKKQKDISRIYDSHIQKENEFKAIKAANKIPVIMINDFTKEDIAAAHSDFVLRDQVVWFKNLKDSASALNALICFGPKIILNELDEKSKEELSNEGMITVDMKPVAHNYYGSVPSDKLANAMNEKQKKSFSEWLERYKKREL
ncbi:MAG: hypothetical protein PHU12_01320 [Candidatus Aenigmarchaeota archaeon]|nr:hypothetical protein [Candidatus Aenigmarchaeota archaeon]